VPHAVFFNQYVNPVALGALGWKYYIVYDCWIAFELFIVYMFYIEVCFFRVLRGPGLLLTVY